jgi:hypothetical protein
VHQMRSLEVKERSIASFVGSELLSGNGVFRARPHFR